MVILTFDRIPSMLFGRIPAILRKLVNRPSSADIGDFEELLYEQPILLQIDDAIVLDHLPIPLFFIARNGLDALVQLTDSGFESLDIPGGGTLEFRLSDNQVTVRERLFKTVATVPYDELLDAWRGFAQEVREYMLRHVPEVVRNPDVGWWFRDEPNPSLD